MTHAHTHTAPHSSWDLVSADSMVLLNLHRELLKAEIKVSVNGSWGAVMPPESSGGVVVGVRVNYF